MHLDYHRNLLDHKESQSESIGEDFYNLRKPHLKDLSELEGLIRNYSPLPISYDNGSPQPTYFNEFTYTECMGCLLVSPRSREVTNRIVSSYVPDYSFISDIILERLQSNFDKYELTTDNNLKDGIRVIFTPGNDCFEQTVSAEIFYRLMFENEDILVKPHPMINEHTIKQIGLDFGFHRIIDPMISGSEVLKKTSHTYVTSSTELGLYSVLLEKPISNITNFFNEPLCAYQPFYRLLWNKSPREAKNIFISCINSFTSGLFHPNDINVENRIKRYFDYCMNIRQQYKPHLFEISPLDWNKALEVNINKEDD